MNFSRRGKLTSGDVDILIYATDGRETVIWPTLNFDCQCISDRCLTDLDPITINLWISYRSLEVLVVLFMLLLEILVSPQIKEKILEYRRIWEYAGGEVYDKLLI